MTLRKLIILLYIILYSISFYYIFSNNLLYCTISELSQYQILLILFTLLFGVINVAIICLFIIYIIDEYGDKKIF